MPMCIRFSIHDEFVSANGSPYAIKELYGVAKNWDFMPMTSSLDSYKPKQIRIVKRLS